MLISEAQRDLRLAYRGGGVGVMISGVVWAVAAFVLHDRGVGPGFVALFVGGMLIFALTKLICRAVLRLPNEAAGNPYGMLVLEGTIAMIGGLFAAWLFVPVRPALVFPIAAIAVGTHYFVFRTAYGNRLYWLLAAVVTAIGCGDIFVEAMRGWTAPLVAVTELIFGLVLLVGAKGRDKP